MGLDDYLIILVIILFTAKQNVTFSHIIKSVMVYCCLTDMTDYVCQTFWLQCSKLIINCLPGVICDILAILK